MLRGLEVLKSFAETIQQLNSESVRAVATHTLRRAKNRNEFPASGTQNCAHPH